MSRALFVLSVLLLALSVVGSLAAWHLGFVQGVQYAEETHAILLDIQASESLGSWAETFRALDNMAYRYRPDLDERERQWRVLRLMLAADREGIDPRLAVSVALIESGFRQDVVSNKGAIGIMQLMPSTAKMYGANPYDVGENIDAGVAYLAYLLRLYKGRLDLALAAYNSGPTRVKTTVPRIRQTQNYVRKVQTLYRGRW